MNDKEKAFVTDLKAVMDKHGVVLNDSDDYDGRNNYCGTTYAFVSRTAPPGINLSLRELTDMLPENTLTPVPAVFGSVFENIKTLTAVQEKVVRQGVCPNCSPQEGRAEQMRLLGEFGPMRAWQCRQCTNVWITSPPNK